MKDQIVNTMLRTLQTVMRFVFRGMIKEAEANKKKVLLSLAKHGCMRPSDISEDTRLSINGVYPILCSLKESGLVEYEEREELALRVLKSGAIVTSEGQRLYCTLTDSGRQTAAAATAAKVEER